MAFVSNTFRGEVEKVQELANTKKSKGHRSKSNGTGHLSLARSAKLNCQGEVHSART
jgi:hypothetical protein